MSGSFVGYADQWVSASAKMEEVDAAAATAASARKLAPKQCTLASSTAFAKCAAAVDTDAEEMELAFMQVGLPKECIALAPEPAFDTLMNDLNMKKTDSLNMMANGIAIIA